MASGLLTKEMIIVDINGLMTLILVNLETELSINARKIYYEFKIT